MKDELCRQPHPFTPINCIKKAGHDKTHWFQAMWDSDEEAIESLINAIAEKDTRPRGVIRRAVYALVEKRKAWL